MSTFVEVITDGDVHRVEVPAEPNKQVVEVRTPGPQGPPGTGGDIAAVLVVTGDEERPDVGTVLWKKGTTQPVNMTSDDIWFKDVTPP